jgi:hypothetical protein
MSLRSRTLSEPVGDEELVRLAFQLMVVCVRHRINRGFGFGLLRSAASFRVVPEGKPRLIQRAHRASGHAATYCTVAVNTSSISLSVKQPVAGTS